MTVTVITYIVLISQLVIMSYYYPQQIINRANFVLNHYPASTHPKLYPSIDGDKKIHKWLNLFKFLAYGSGILFITALIGAVASSTTIIAPVVFFFAMLQFSPFLLLEISGFKYNKMLRLKNTSSKRSATIKPRHLLDYVSSGKLAVAAALLIGYLIFNQYRVGFELSYKSAGFVTLISMILVHTMFASIVIWRLRGKKINPHQSNEDRERDTQGTVTSMVNVSMLMSVFLFVFGLIQHFSLDQYEAASMSIYMQLCAFLSLGTMLKANSLKKIDFDVYKNDVTSVQ